MSIVLSFYTFWYDATNIALLDLDIQIYFFFSSTFSQQLCQVGWGLLLGSHFQVPPELFDWVQVRTLAQGRHSCVAFT